MRPVHTILKVPGCFRNRNRRFLHNLRLSDSMDISIRGANKQSPYSGLGCGQSMAVNPYFPRLAVPAPPGKNVTIVLAPLRAANDIGAYYSIDNPARYGHSQPGFWGSLFGENCVKRLFAVCLGVSLLDRKSVV